MTDRKTALALTIGLVIFAWLASPALANASDEAEEVYYGRSGVYLEANAHAMVPAFRHDHSGSVSAGADVRAGWRVGGYFAAELQYSWNKKFETHAANLITVNGKIFPLPESRLQPFARMGLGAIFGNTEQYSEMKGSFVARFGLGADYWATENWAITVYGDFVLPTDHFADLTHFNIGSGVRYRF